MYHILLSIFCLFITQKLKLIILIFFYCFQQHFIIFYKILPLTNKVFTSFMWLNNKNFNWIFRIFFIDAVATFGIFVAKRFHKVTQNNRNKAYFFLHFFQLSFDFVNVISIFFHSYFSSQCFILFSLFYFIFIFFIIIFWSKCHFSVFY